MRHGLAPLLAAVCFHGAAAELPPCDHPVRFSAAWFADPEVDNSKSAAEVTGIGSGAAGAGLQIGHVIVETKLAVVPQTLCQGVVVRLDYVKPVLRVAREFAPGTCAYARVMNHEQTHVRIHRDIARNFRELRYPWSPGAKATDVMAFARQELDRLMQAQVLFDSPEEYARNQTVCGGEIMKRVSPVATKVATKP